MKKEIIKYIKENFYGVSLLPDIVSIEYIEGKIDEYHENNQLDIELIIYESLILLIPPIADYVKSIELLERIKTYETIILKSIIQYNNIGFIDDDKINALKYFSDKKKDAESVSIINYLLALAIDNQDDKIEYLNKSISLNPSNVLGYIELSKELNKKEKLKESNILLKKGLANVVRIISKDDKIDIADYDFFIRESIIGNIVTKELFDYWQSLLSEKFQ